ncbi:PDDEXK nuclease domain-containing protein [Actimicrobium sp. CCI2.3]|uniref:PDDEXK nuclease domain-containing protein n=1 Tax=Actimicrobium sp. CCI2.3 TaxID=3048616 RepID=UPI002AB3835A|nr:PDDEXK nuclease domain-containing protein [Actimicrobium sp. CCI2.3]MDY7574476.1 PDDEXK nuclease domain-containing protein [Actimicrobium sp. CCI2.3]
MRCPILLDHYIVSKCKSDEERLFYLQRATQEHWSVREIAREIDSRLFERVLVNGGPLLSTALKERHTDAASLFKDRYLVDFLDLPLSHSEQDLQCGLVRHLKNFLLELGSDFCFIGNEYRLSVGLKAFLCRPAVLPPRTDLPSCSRTENR